MRLPMTYFSPDQLKDLQQLLAANEIQVLAKQGGGNSVVYCIEGSHQKWALKSYPPYAPNQRDRLNAEFTVYQFFKHHQLSSVPQLINHCEKNRWLIMEWIEGEVPTHSQSEDVAQALLFLQAIAHLNAKADAMQLPEAAEACLSLELLLQQIEKRLHRLQSLVGEDELQSFLSDCFIPQFTLYAEKAKKGFISHAIPIDEKLPKNKQSLIPADFGFHNSIRDQKGQLYFFDFDYFGWDDPVKLLADILWHPKMSLTPKEAQQFIEGIAKIYAEDPLFLPRFELTKPLFGLRWTLILLNEFIPAFWQNRQHAGAFNISQHEAKCKQLKRANALLSAL